MFKTVDPDRLEGQASSRAQQSTKSGNTSCDNSGLCAQTEYAALHRQPAGRTAQQLATHQTASMQQSVVSDPFTRCQETNNMKQVTAPQTAKEHNENQIRSRFQYTVAMGTPI